MGQGPRSIHSHARRETTGHVGRPRSHMQCCRRARQNKSTIGRPTAVGTIPLQFDSETSARKISARSERDDSQLVGTRRRMGSSLLPEVPQQGLIRTTNRPPYRQGYRRGISLSSTAAQSWPPWRATTPLYVRVGQPQRSCPRPEGHAPSPLASCPCKSHGKKYLLGHATRVLAPR